MQHGLTNLRVQAYLGLNYKISRGMGESQHGGSFSAGKCENLSLSNPYPRST